MKILVCLSLAISLASSSLINENNKLSPENEGELFKQLFKRSCGNCCDKPCNRPCSPCNNKPITVETGNSAIETQNSIDVNFNMENKVENYNEVHNPVKVDSVAENIITVIPQKPSPPKTVVEYKDRPVPVPIPVPKPFPLLQPYPIERHVPVPYVVNRPFPVAQYIRVPEPYPVVQPAPIVSPCQQNLPCMNPYIPGGKL